MKTNTLLAVDDKPDNLYVLQSLIAKHLPECRVLTASSAKEGLAAAAETDFDGILADVQMPGTSGIEMCRRLKSDERTAHMPVIMITAHNTESKLKAEALQAGADDFLTKPIDNIELVAKIKVMLRIKHAQDELLDINAHLDQLVAEKTQALKKSEEYFRALIENSSDVISIIDEEGNITYESPSHKRVLGYNTGKLIGKNAFELVHPDDLERISLQFAGLLHKPGKIEQVHFRFLHQDDTWRYIEGTCRNLLKTPSIKGIVINYRDITELMWAEEEKTRLEEQFHQAQKLESIGRLAGGVAHDLNNMLTPILGYGEMLMEDAAGNDPRREPVEEIVDAGMRARDLVHQLLAFSRRQTLEFKLVDMNTLLEKFKNLLRHTIREDIAIKLVPARSLPLIRGDVGQLEQVIMNLAVNAQDSMPDGGELIIETSPVELDESYAAKHRGVTPGSYVMLVFSDTGCGMDTKTLEHLFEPFFTTKSKDKGTGLGLSTVYGIVKQHGGNIWVYSEPGLGSTFRIYLPVSAESPDSKENAEKTPKELRGSETILLVEDNEQVRNLALAILKQKGYTVLVAESGKEALAILDLHDGPLHLLLTDVVMPGMNGKQLFERVSGQNPDVAVLYMSGYTEDVIAYHGMMDAGIHFIQKPFAVNALAAKVREVLDD